MHRCRSQSGFGFTLIELLIVIAIIMLLAGLILAGMGLLRENAELTATHNKIQVVQGRLEAGRTEDAGLCQVLQDTVLGRPLRWSSLRQTMQELISQHGLLLENSGHYSTLPPYLWSIYDTNVGCFQGLSWNPMRYDSRDGLEFDGTVVRQPTLNNVVIWQNKRDFTQELPFVTRAGPPLGTLRWDDKDTHGTRLFLWWRRGTPPVPGVDVRWSWTYQVTSPLGETLDSTSEVLPDARRPVAWYRQQWPTVREARDGELYVQKAWPDSDWDQATPGSVPPIWEAPFGRHLICRATGKELNQHLRREAGAGEVTLADFSPLPGMALLERILPEATAERYRNERQRDRAWNDAWGNPLILTAGLYLAPRYDLDPGDPTTASHEQVNGEFFDDLKGGRDWLMQRGREVYGFHRAVHVAVGALGEKRDVFGSDNPIASVIDGWKGTAPLTWEAVEDAQVLRAAWLQVREVCGAGQYTSTRHQNDKPWTGITKVTKQGCTSLLSAPIEISK